MGTLMDRVATRKSKTKQRSPQSPRIADMVKDGARTVHQNPPAQSAMVIRRPRAPRPSLESR
ncbi:ATP-dependent helicase HrpB [Anopheles sinensis]|uniref:ATP-dependent helicase HrpB n=1 Tax=Anopheles sinensis TaxID=74873 RepID=A0A084VH43_ANOSI|nr:ATP-dependent helicase HrpB [Anopheles sinensis]